MQHGATANAGSGATAGKTRVAVLFGGRSGEHEVSLRSAASVIRHLDAGRFEVIPIGIDKQGQWWTTPLAQLEYEGESVKVPARGSRVSVPLEAAHGTPRLEASGREFSVDVIFPVLHGTFCEDGTLQGLLDLAEIPYVGCGVLASSVGMDKEVAKRVARDAGIPIVPFVTVRDHEWKRDSDLIRERVQLELGFPVFVKPANSGSSVGVHKVKEAGALAAAMADAFLYDAKVLVERGISAREIEMSVLESPKYGNPPEVSTPGEIVPTHEFYSYDAKYLDEDGARLHIPARITDAQLEEAQQLARDIFVALECEGMARVDLFLDRASGHWYLNEINTLPGFTSISMYPKLWEASGLKYGPLLTTLVELALARADRRGKLLREFAGARKK